MPPLINRYTRRYQPFSRPLALHSSFPAESHACPPHSLYTIYPTDPDVPEDLPVVALAQQKAVDLEEFYKKLDIVLSGFHVRSPQEEAICKQQKWATLTQQKKASLTQQQLDDQNEFLKKLDFVLTGPHVPSQHEQATPTQQKSDDQEEFLKKLEILLEELHIPNRPMPPQSSSTSTS